MTDGDTGARDDGPDRSTMLFRGGLAVVLLAVVGAIGGWFLAGEGDPVTTPPAAEGTSTTATPGPARTTPQASTPAAPRTSAPSRSAGLTVPPVVGDDFTDARAELRERKLGWRLVFGAGTGTTVERTSPEVGTEVRPGRTVTLYVSGPAPAAEVPDVVGEDCDDAADELVDEGFYPRYRTGKVGKVGRQEPAGDGAGRWNDQVSIWCGDAPETGGPASPTP
ncbi:PASTA domain-containing protein [Micromonospora sp. KLBMP9576]|uniref:PASTA domain-containing protein n=1 Tax=Micromonospora sp. KLBMP9576 TaxID=3424769 RepID=UPI003D942D86